MKWFCFLMAVFLSSCTTFQKKLSPTADKSLLFPSGVYTHQVQIETKSHGSYCFQGVVKITPGRVVVVGLSPFQTTLFKIDENRETGTIDAEIYQDTLQKHRASLIDFYRTLSAFLTLKRNGQGSRGSKVKAYERDSSGNLREVGVIFMDEETRIKVLGYDANGIAQQFQIYHPKFTVTVNVVGYEG
jgi:hypothetical protein